MDGLEFTTNEQNALAMICESLASIAYQYNRHGQEPDPEKLTDDVCRVLDSFPNTNWGDLYDRFHRQGKNST